MNLGSEMRTKMRVGLVSGFLMGISFFVADIVSLFNVEWLDLVIGFAVFLGAGFIYDYEARKIPRIVAEMDKELTKAREQARVGKLFCRYCGAENKSDAVFCEKCGKKISL